MSRTDRGSLAYVLAVWVLSAAAAAAIAALGGVRGPGGLILPGYLLLPGLTGLAFRRAGPGPRLERSGFNAGGARNYLAGWTIATVVVTAAFLLTVATGAGRPDSSLRDISAESIGMSRAGPGGFILLSFFVNLVLAPWIKVPFSLGSELGWRAFLLPRLIPRGKLAALLLPGLAAGVSRVPLVLLGYAFPGHPVGGSLLTVAYHTLVGVVLGWLYLRTQSIIVPTVTLGVFESLPMAFMLVIGGFDPRLGSSTGLIGLVLLAIAAVPILAGFRLAELASYRKILPPSLWPEPDRGPRQPWEWPQ